MNGSGWDWLRLKCLCHPSGDVSPQGLELRQNVWPRNLDSGSSVYRCSSSQERGRAQLRREEGQGRSRGVAPPRSGRGDRVRSDSEERLEGAEGGKPGA